MQRRSPSSAVQLSAGVRRPGKVHIALQAIALAVVLAVPACSEQPYRTYATVPEAVAGGEGARGWLPPWLPASATNIHLQGDLDTNHVWLRFDLAEPDRSRLIRFLVPIPDSEVEETRWRWPRHAARWWFEALIQQAPADDAALYSKLYRAQPSVASATTVIAFDRNSTRVYAWWQ